MSRLVRWLLLFAVAISISAASAYVAIATQLFRPTPSIALTTDLDSDAQFTRRLMARYPIGSSEAAMAAALQEDDFSRSDWAFSYGQEHEAEAVRKEFNGACGRLVTVYWRADKRGRLVNIRGKVEGWFRCL